MPVTQTARVIEVATPLGKDVLVFSRMTGAEQLGRLFEFHLELMSENDQIPLKDLLAQNVTVRLELPEGGTRYFNGFVSHFSYVGWRRSLAHYQMTLRPWFWFLTRAADCRIFQDMSAPDIIKQVFRDHGFTDFQDYLSGSYRTWEYCVQYRETDFNFISRLMEQEGMYYYFSHENGKHLLVLADANSSHNTFPDYATVPFYPPDIHDRRLRDHLYEWTLEQAVQPGRYALNDFDFKVPKKNLRSTASIPRPHVLSDFEIYDYPGEYVDSGEGNAYAKLRIEELQAQYETARAEGNAQGLATGYLFTLEKHPRSDQNKEYLITAASYELRSNEYETEVGGQGGAYYGINLTAMDAKQPYRAPRLTPKPVVQGPQTAVVVGPAGEEIWTDEFGRVKCQFHWDRYGRADENSSCWIRVAQSWAGKKWGAMYIPRIGHEVIVEFLEGDPDRPIITGRVYNGENKPPYALPDKATMSTLKSNSSKGGGGCNEIRFEDKKGQEQVFIHAERNEDIQVKADCFESIGGQRHLTVEDDQLEKVGGDKHQTVEGDHNIKVGGSQSLNVGMDLLQKVGMKQAVDAGMEIHLKAGMNVVIEAGISITLKAAGGFIVLGPSGVIISGTTILLNSGGAAGSGSGCSPSAPQAPQGAETGQAGDTGDAEAQPEHQKTAKSLTSTAVGAYSNPQAQALADAAQSGAAFIGV